MLPVVLYGCETWSLTLREERRLRVFENRILRPIAQLEILFYKIYKIHKIYKIYQSGISNFNKSLDLLISSMVMKHRLLH